MDETVMNGSIRIYLIIVSLAVLSETFCTPYPKNTQTLFPISCFIFNNSHWRGTLSLPGLEFGVGDGIESSMEFSIPRRLVAPIQKDLTAIWIAVVGERIYDAHGHPHRWTNHFGSTLLTPTGMPVENYQFVMPVGKLGHPYGSPIEMVARVPPERWDMGLWDLRIATEMSDTLLDTPVGYYQLHTEVLFEFADGPMIPSSLLGLFLDGMELSVKHLDLLKMMWHSIRASRGQAPIIRIGKPNQPKMIWTLLTRQAIRGMRGVVADEDRAYFALSNRFRFPGPLIVPKGRYNLNPDCPIDFSTSYF